MNNFLLAGNGSFRNHGCEAIARGTIRILKHTFGFSTRINYAAHDSRQACIEDTSWLGYENIEPMPFLLPFRKYSKVWIEYQSNRFFHTAFPMAFKHLCDVMAQADAVLSIGGDNYSLDYGYPERFVQFDRLVLKHHKPLVYWCSSVGPFSADPKYERKMKAHFGKVTAILARESGTVAYLKSLGITDNVYLVADPGFVMDAVKPDPVRFTLDRKDFIGVNFSTTVGRLSFSGQRESDPSANWSALLNQTTDAYEQVCRKYADIAAPLMEIFDNNLAFVPHVTGGPHCDYMFMSRIADILEARGFPRPLVVPDNLTAPEYKWVIAQARIFIGARTHSTIAAFSSGIPTISLAYSLKARGLTKDMYGTDRFCIGGRDVNPERVLSLVQVLLSEGESFRERLKQQAHIMSERAFSAGKILADVIR